MADWKKAHASASQEAAQHQLVENALTEFAFNMGFERDGLPEYWLQKIVMTVAQVVRARTLGLDPDLLRLTPEEATDQQLQIMRRFVAIGTEGYDILVRRKGAGWTVAAFRTDGEHLHTAMRVSLHGGIEEARKAINEDVALLPVGLVDHPDKRAA